MTSGGANGRRHERQRRGYEKRSQAVHTDEGTGRWPNYKPRVLTET
jgi:hypothetical protein